MYTDATLPTLKDAHVLSVKRKAIASTAHTPLQCSLMAAWMAALVIALMILAGQ
jgi:hypothetical protein